MNVTNTLRRRMTIPRATARRPPANGHARPGPAVRCPGRRPPLLAWFAVGLLLILAAIGGVAAATVVAAVTAVVWLLPGGTGATIPAARTSLEDRVSSHADGPPTLPSPSSRSPPTVTIARLRHLGGRWPRRPQHLVHATSAAASTQR